MGMRIQTAIGYGLDLTGLNREHLKNQYEGDEKLWDRLTKDILKDIRASEPKDEQKNALLSDKIFFGEGYQSKSSLEGNKEIPFHLNNCILYNEEFFLEDKALILPYPFGRRWTRRDDDIDYYVSGILEPLLEPTQTIWEESQRCIYPHIGLMRRNSHYHLGVETYMESCYMDRDPEYVATLSPMVPLHILFFVKHLFQVDEKDLLDVFFRIKPTFARWWS
jgi:hypothetical protein